MTEQEKDKLIKLIETIYKINFGEIKFVFQNGKIYEIIELSRERVLKSN